MLNVFVDVLAALAGLVLALCVCLLMIRNKRLSRRFGGAAVAGAMLLGLGNVFGGSQQEAVQESKDETSRKKDAQSGEPPVPGG